MTDFEREYEVYKGQLQFEAYGLHPAVPNTGIMARKERGEGMLGNVEVFNYDRFMKLMSDPSSPTNNPNDSDAPLWNWQRLPTRTLYLMSKELASDKWAFPRLPFVPSEVTATVEDDQTKVATSIKNEPNPIRRAKLLRQSCSPKPLLAEWFQRASRQLFGKKSLVYVPAGRPQAYWRESLKERVAVPRGFHHFYVMAQWVSGHLEVPAEEQEHSAWLTREEIAGQLNPEAWRCLEASLQE